MGGVVLCQGRQQGETHLAHAADKGLLLHLDALVLQQVRGLVEDLHALGALERAVLAHHALVLVGVGEVGDVVPAHPALVPPTVAYLQGRLLCLGRVLLLGVLPTPMLRTPTMLLVVLTMLL